MGGLPEIEEIRSISKLGLSVVTIVFQEGTDIYHARNLVKERLAAAKIAVGDYGDPQIGPLTTALGEILQFEVRGDGYSPMELRTTSGMGNRAAPAGNAGRHRSQLARRLLQDVRGAGRSQSPGRLRAVGDRRDRRP